MMLLLRKLAHLVLNLFIIIARQWVYAFFCRIDKWIEWKWSVDCWVNMYNATRFLLPCCELYTWIWQLLMVCLWQRMIPEIKVAYSWSCRLFNAHNPQLTAEYELKNGAWLHASGFRKRYMSKKWRFCEARGRDSMTEITPILYSSLVQASDPTERGEDAESLRCLLNQHLKCSSFLSFSKI